uniref:Uncharacterized protein n=1 Tax=Solanum lycopersicum TaxID=4081 RepID=A0A494G8C9_SOLLC
MSHPPPTTEDIQGVVPPNLLKGSAPSLFPSTPKSIESHSQSPMCLGGLRHHYPSQPCLKRIEAPLP